VAAHRPLRVRMLRGVPHHRVHAELARADIAIDQLNSETSGIFALEAMALGVPVLIEYRPDALASFARDTPLVRVTAETLADELEALCADPARRAELSARGAEFVRRVHDPAQIAPILERIYAHARRREPGRFEVTAGGLVRIPWPPG
jgi:glycosyltransferase involved in cell wall biosynthesis